MSAGISGHTESPRNDEADISGRAQKKDRLVAFLVGTSGARSELTSMTDQSDLRRDKRDDKFYISWIIRGGIVLAIVIAALAFTSTNYPDVPQIPTTVPAPAS